MADKPHVNELGDTRPPLSSRERRRLLRHWEKAADLLEKGEMRSLEYAAVAVHTGLRLGGQIASGESLVGRELELFDHLHAGVWELLAEEAGGELEDTLPKYGPYNVAVQWLPRASEGPLTVDSAFRHKWTEACQEALERGRLRLSPWPRLKLRWEARMERNKKHFPHTSTQIEKLTLSFFSALFGAIVGALIALIGIG